VAASEESPVTHLLVLLTLAGLVNLGLPSLDGCRADKLYPVPRASCWAGKHPYLVLVVGLDPFLSSR